MVRSRTLHTDQYVCNLRIVKSGPAPSLFSYVNGVMSRLVAAVAAAGQPGRPAATDFEQASGGDHAVDFVGIYGGCYV
jgi:hypothetical protein